MENCNECPCSCKPVSQQCITKYSDITNPTILSVNHYQKASDDIDSLIGIDCADELCAALEQAVEDLAEYNTNNPGGPEKTTEDFLSAKWLNIIENRHFKKWYSNRLLWHWLHGASISELTVSGLVTTSNNDTDYKNQFQNALETERRRMQDSAEFYSSDAKNKFIHTYWNKKAHLYSCVVLDCGCSKKYKCKQHNAPPNTGIGMSVI